MMDSKIFNLTIVIFFLHICPNIQAKEIKYKVADIPKELKENARSVVRNEEITLEVISIDKANVKVSYAITILNNNGLGDAYFRKYYSKLTKITDIEGRIYDENGEQIRKITSSDILDYSAISGYTTYADNRVKTIDPKVRNFPFTVEYSYEQSYDGLFSYPSWNPQADYNIGVEKSSYKAIVPKNLSFRYLERNTSSKVVKTSDAEKNIYYFEVQGLKALETEPYSLSSQEIFPFMLAAPTDFEIEGYKGNLNSWKDFGVFVSTLNDGKNVLNDETKTFLVEWVSKESDEYQKVKKIYEYMQGRTRYVSIQIGIGGWQPFDAATVHRLSYGDCKALSNYMKTMLETIGIRSHYCLVNAGGEASMMIKEFPSTQFNHAFLCVPLKNDTIWLECTSQQMPCGFIGDFTDDRDVLLIDNEKSKVVHTKAYNMADNLKTSVSHVKIDETGKGSVKIFTIYKGINYGPAIANFLADDTDKKRRISERMRFPGFQIVDYKYKENRTIIPSIEEAININFENYITTIGSRLLLQLNFSNRVSSPANVRSRKTVVYVRRPLNDVDTITYDLPESLKPESMPNAVAIKTQFGEYQAKVELANNQLVYIRSFQLFKGQYPASDYTGFVEFFDKISTADGIRCALVKN